MRAQLKVERRPGRQSSGRAFPPEGAAGTGALAGCGVGAETSRGEGRFRGLDGWTEAPALAGD